MSKKTTNTTAPGDEPAPADELSYEEAMAEIESITDRLESGEIGLEASVDAYARGKALIARCRSLIDRAEQRVRELGDTDDDAPERAD